jgi:uncharacterized protein
MLLYKETHSKQSALAEYCKGKEFPGDIVDLDEKRAYEYQRLVRNIFDDTLSMAFPLTHALLSPKEWKGIIQAFLKNHSCQSPQVWSMPKEFYEFVDANETALKSKFKYLTELMQFEWLELEVYMMEDEEQTGEFVDSCDVHTANFTINTETRIAGFEFPVHLKNAKFISPSDKAQYFVALHRDPENGKVLFTNLKSPHLQVLHQLIEKDSCKFDDLISIFLRYGSAVDAEQALQKFIESAISNKLLLVTEN